MKIESIPPNLNDNFKEKENFNNLINKLETQKDNLYKNLKMFQKTLFEKDNELNNTTDTFKKSILRLELSHLLREEDLYIKKIKNIENKIVINTHKSKF
ncbi:MAG: hypothetical protein ACFFAO_12550 [Candidatus Hermodarchaeota archaeon]